MSTRRGVNAKAISRITAAFEAAPSCCLAKLVAMSRSYQLLTVAAAILQIDVRREPLRLALCPSHPLATPWTRHLRADQYFPSCIPAAIASQEAGGFAAADLRMLSAL